MQFLEEEILEITESTWNSLLGLEIQPDPTHSMVQDGEEIYMGEAGISGAWEGQVRLHWTRALAQSAAAKIFQLPVEGVTEQDQIDSIYELTNIIAGNIKSILPEPCCLSLPTVQVSTEWDANIPEADCVSELAFQCEGQPLLVAMWKRR